MQVDLPRATVAPEARGVVVRVEVLLLSLYKRFVSPMLGQRCRFTPTCSVYAMDALARHGWLKGNAKIVWRILRCAPWCQGGHDPA